MEIDKVYSIKAESNSRNDDIWIYSKLISNLSRLSVKTDETMYEKDVRKDNSLSSRLRCIGRISYYSEIILGIRVFREYSDLFWRKVKGKM